jgi:phage shock protein A
MSQQVSVEAALPVFRQRCSELHDESLILRARVAELEQQLADAHQEIEQLRSQPPMGQTPQPLSAVDPGDLA